MTDQENRCGSCGAGGCDSGSCGSEGCSENPETTEENLDDFLENDEMRRQLAQIKHKIVVLSGKGGVGKSTVAVNIATSLAMQGKEVGLLDVDIHGPSVPTLLKLQGQSVRSDGQKLIPIAVGDNLKVMSIGFLLENADDALIWRGPMKIGVIQQFLKDVNWGRLDYLVIDMPPGTGDEPLSVAQLIPDISGAVVVTTPQEVSLADVRKSITFCKKLKMPILGVVENMSGFVCPHCGEVTEIFKSGGAEKMVQEMKVPFLGRIPIDPRVVTACDAGEPFVYHYSKTDAAKAFEKLATMLESLESDHD